MSDNILDPNYDPRLDGVVREGPGRAINARHAATLIIVRRDGPSPRLLLGRRNGGHSFMPGKWVFPGGRVDRGDFTAPAESDLRPEVATALSHQPRHRNPVALPRALAMAAIRETFEEAGLLLAKAAPARPGSGPWRPFLAIGALPDLAALSFVARAITPPYRPRRFDTRFFMADAESLLSLNRLPDCGELDEVVWVDLAEAQALDLPNITRFVVGEVAARLAAPTAPRRIPYIRFHAGARRLEEI